MDAPAISFATPADIPALVSLRTAVAQAMARKFGPGDWATLPTAAIVRKQLRASRVLIARNDTGVVGTVRLAQAQPALFDASAFTPVRQALYVLGLAVAPDARGQGIATRLMEASKAHACDARVDALWLDVFDGPAGAGIFYERCGFRAAGKAQNGVTPLIFYEWLTRKT